MDFDIEEILQKLINDDKLSEAIQFAEKGLSKFESTDFPEIIGEDLLNQVKELEKYLDSCFRKIKRKSLIESFWNQNNEESIKAIYGEMNGFSINYDLWFVDFFKFNFIGEKDDLDWLADGQGLSNKSFIIKGFEEIQKIYQVHHQNKMYEYDEHEDAADTCDYVVILRLFELFYEVINKGKLENKEWSKIPFFVTSHDCELVYKMNID